MLEVGLKAKDDLRLIFKSCNYGILGSRDYNITKRLNKFD